LPRAQSRKHRGYKTQRLIAERWVLKGLYPDAYAIGAGAPGNDIQRTGSLAVEVKARDTVSLPAALKQALDSWKVTKEKGRHEGVVPIVVWRHNGQGESNMNEWTVTMRLADFEKYEELRLEHGFDT
jgi:hypothetical protein